VDVISAAREAVETLKKLDGSEARDIPVSVEDLAAAGLDRVLMDLAEKPDREVAMDALEGLGRLRTPKAVPLALKAFQHTNPMVRVAAAHCLGAFGRLDKDVVACLRGGLSDQVEPVAMASAEALAELADVESAPLVAERMAAYRAVGPVPWVMGDSLARLLGAECDPGIRGKAVGTLIGYLSHPTLQVRNCTCRILRRCAMPGYTEHNDAMLEAAGSPSLDRAALYTAIGISGDSRSIPGLLWCLSNSDKEGRDLAGRALAGLGGQGLDALREYAADVSQEPDGRISATEANDSRTCGLNNSSNN
jgi:HEAT repeat protein